MRYTVLISIFLFAILMGCNKDKNGSTPSLKFKSVNTTELRSGQLIQFTLSFTGGSPNDSVFVQKVVPYCAGSTFSQVFSLPSFPASKNQKGEITVTFGYNNSNSAYQNIAPQCAPQNDTAIFRFALKADSSHISDTVSSPRIIIYSQ